MVAWIGVRGGGYQLKCRSPRHSSQGLKSVEHSLKTIGVEGLIHVKSEVGIFDVDMENAGNPDVDLVI
ncbi:hypothetical protein TNCV_4168531 [Trichonephila clavipes]|nr:hypothetical protein TNCV_4168531 [Trichonephila clavipes]